jgi:hypothetical protein
MATANNNFITGAVLGDLVLGAYNTNNIWFINNNTNTTRMRLDSDGGGTFSGFVSASGPKSQIRVNGNSVGCGISLTNTIVGANRRNWGIFTEENVEGDFVINRSTTSGGSANTTVLSLSRDGAATFSSSVRVGGASGGDSLVSTANAGTNPASFSFVNSGGTSYIGAESSGGGSLVTGSTGYDLILRGPSGITFSANNGASPNMRITSGGNVGIGIVPQTWNTSWKSLQVGNSTLTGNGVADAYIGQNVYIGSDGNWKYSNSYGACIMGMETNSWAFYNAPSGTAGTNISWSERMRITSSGQVQINSQTSSNDNVLKLFIDSTQASIQATYGSTGSYVPIRFLTSDTERMRIDTNGCVNIGTTGGFGKLDVGGQTSGSAQNICRLGNISGVNNGLLIQVNSSNNYIYNFGTLGTGTVVATANVLSATSDMNLKVEDGYIDNALEKVLKLKPRYFYWKEETGMPTDLRQLGFYAQEVNEAIGEEVANSPKNDNEKWGIYDRGMIAFLTKAIQEQTQIIKNLEARIVSLESK